MEEVAAGGTRACPCGEGVQRRQQPGVRVPTLVGALLSTGEAGAGTWEESLQWWPHPLHITQQ